MQYTESIVMGLRLVLFFGVFPVFSETKLLIVVIFNRLVKIRLKKCYKLVFSWCAVGTLLCVMLWFWGFYDFGYFSFLWGYYLVLWEKSCIFAVLLTF